MSARVIPVTSRKAQRLARLGVPSGNATSLGQQRSEVTAELAPPLVLPTVAVVVCAFSLERLGQTRRCIEAVLGGERPPDELLLVIDNNLELRELFAAELGNRITVLDNTGHGLSEGRNTGWRRATSEIVAFIDDDAWPEPDWLAELVTAFSDPAVLGAGGRIEPDWEEPTLALPPELYWIVGSTYRGHREDKGPITRPIGANMAARRSALSDLGGFSPSFGRRTGMKESSNEELAFFATLAEELGTGRIWYAPTAVVHHFAPADRCSFSYLVARSTVEGTSKADVAHLFGKDVMAHDRSYVSRVLLPSTLRYLWRGATHFDRIALRNGCALLASFSLTAISYVRRLLAKRALALLSPARRALPLPEQAGAAR